MLCCDTMLIVEKANIDLRSVITRDELDAWQQLCELGNADGAYDTCIERWQQRVSTVAANRKRERDKLISEYALNMAMFTKSAVVIAFAIAIIVFAFTGIDGCVKSDIAKTQTQKEAYAKQKTETGYFDSSQSWKNTQIKDAPIGVKIQSWSIARDTSASNVYDSTLTYVLWLPKIADNKVYAVAHTLLNNYDTAINSGLFYTRPKEYGFCRFVKKIQDGDYAIYWLRPEVQIVDAGSVIDVD